MWTYILTNLKGSAIGEVRNATGRQASLKLNGVSTAQFQIRSDNELVASLLAEDTLLQIWEDDEIRFYGFVTSAQLASEDATQKPTITVTAASPAWRLSKRLLGQSTGGTIYEGDKAKSARKMINELNTDTKTYPTNPNTRIKVLEESEYSAGGSGEYTAGPYAEALSCINDLAHTLDGFDWYISPLVGDETYIGTFEAKPTFGSEKEVVFEYGWGTHNISKFNFTCDLSVLTNKAFHLPSEGLEKGEVKQFSDNPSMELRGRYEAIADAPSLIEAELREDWLELFIRVRKNPRFIAAMTFDIDDGTGRVPSLGTDYWLGDVVTARAVLEGTTTLFNGKVRVYAVNIEVSETGTATIQPILVDEEGTAL